VPAVPSRFGATAENFGRGLAFFAGLAAHLGHLPTREQARAAVRRRLQRRETDFLAVVRRGIYSRPDGPYRRLLGQAGCELGDFTRLVTQEGIEGALTALFQQGVYLTESELKGLRPVKRGSLEFHTSLRQIRNPCWRVPAPIVETTAGRARLVPIYFAMLQDLAVNASLSLDAQGGTRWAHAVWRSPHRGGLLWLLRYTGRGYRPARWLSRVPVDRTLPAEQRWMAHGLRLTSALAGCPMPPPEHVPVGSPERVVAWMHEQLVAGRTPHLSTTVSAAIHTATVAVESGIDLSGAQFGTSGEPLTADRLAAIQRSGGAVHSSFGAKETGLLAFGCLAPRHPDDLHLYQDLYALIQVGAASHASELPADALLATVLQPSWPLVALNLSLGDRATVEQRRCGCPLEALGWSTHLHTIRGFEKLKIGATAMLADGVIRLLEAELPGRFGGSPTDYQLVEDDAEVVDGQTRLRLLVHPAVGSIDEAAVRESFLTLVRRSGVQVDQMWNEKRWVEVERRAPLVTAGEKIYHVHRASWPLE
jgi:hypothetical protein